VSADAVRARGEAVINALEELVRTAMAGFAGIAERAARGEVDMSAPIGDALDD
jgi:hypothetical protein